MKVVSCLEMTGEKYTGRCEYDWEMRLGRQIAGPDIRGHYGPGCEGGTMSQITGAIRKVLSG